MLFTMDCSEIYFAQIIIILTVWFWSYSFYRKYHFPETIGCLDGTHVEIVCPSDDEDAFYNTKGQYSIHAQMVNNPFYIMR